MPMVRADGLSHITAWMGENEMSNPMRHCDFYRYCASAIDDPDAYVWVHPCCGGPWEERPYGHYASCPEGLNKSRTGRSGCGGDR